MANEQNGDSAVRPEAEFAEALKELQRGERTAQALEDHLDSLERKIEELLAQAEKNDTERSAQQNSSSEKPAQEDGKSS